MAKTFHLEIIATDRIFFSGEVEHLVKYAAISEGFIQVMPDSSIILADTCELPEEIDIKRAQEARERAEERLRQKQSIKEYYETQAALNRAMNRLKISQKHFK